MKSRGTSKRSPSFPDVGEATPLVRVVDDDVAVLRAVERRLQAAGFRVETFSSVSAFREHEPADAPGCLVLDLRLPEQSGLDLQAALLRAGNPLPVIILTGDADVPTSVQAMKRGAVDFLLKPVRGEDLVDAVNRALARDAQGRFAMRSLAEERALLDGLTPREREVFALVVRGLLNKQIAAELGTSERTIKAHRARVMRKMKVGSVADLARLAERLSS